jgi:hypothetical protein
MATNMKAPNVIQIERVARFQSEIRASEAVRVGQYSFASEVVGLIFGMMTLCWIITSLCALT